MTVPAKQFPFVPRESSFGEASLAPMLELNLIGERSVMAPGLVDSGAAVNVLPYSLGMQLGFDWDRQIQSVELSGNLAAVESRIVVLSGLVAGFPTVRLAFAWAKTDDIPVILGQVNFFLEFDVCFFRSRGLFEVRPKSDLGIQA